MGERPAFGAEVPQHRIRQIVNCVQKEFFQAAGAADAKRCLKGGADPNAHAMWGSTPLHNAAYRNENAAVVAALLGAGAEEDIDTPLHYASDIDLLIVANDLTLEDVYSALIPVEADHLDRRIHPTLYAPSEFADRKAANSGFLTSVLGGGHLVLIEREGEATAAR